MFQKKNQFSENDKNTYSFQHKVMTDLKITCNFNIFGFVQINFLKDDRKGI